MLARGATKEGVALDEGGGDKGGSSLFKEVSTLKMKLMASTKRRTQAKTSKPGHQEADADARIAGQQRGGGSRLASRARTPARWVARRLRADQRVTKHHALGLR